MQHDALAMTYARSLFEMAEEAGGRAKIEELADEIEQLVELLARDAAFRNFLASPIIDRDRRRDSLRRMFNGRITDLLLRFLLVLNDKGRLSKLEPIAAAYDHLVQEHFGRIEVDVITPAPLGTEAQQAVRERIQKALGREPVLHLYTDPKMIGGVKLRVGDRLIDGSVETQLRRMKAALLRGGGWKLRGSFARFIEERPDSPKSH
jgi:F-type H+-transporting ATPase subunit delta